MKKKTILIISHVIPHPPRAGNELRIKKMILWLRNHGYRVELLLNHDTLDIPDKEELQKVVDDLHFRDKYSKVLPFSPNNLIFFQAFKLFIKKLLNSFGLLRYFEHRLTSEQVKTDLCPPALVSTAAKLCKNNKPFAVIAEYIFTAPCLDVLDDTILKIIDTHDMFSRKKEQVITHGVPDHFACSRQEERNLLLKGDSIIAIQEIEAEMFRDLVPERQVITVGIDFPIHTNSSEEIINGIVLVVGSDNPLNLHGLYAFCDHAWPRILSACPKASLRVVGTISDHIRPRHKNIVKVGWVSNLDDEYRRAAVVINPVLAGTGLKIKSVEALARGKALVTTQNGAEGITGGGVFALRVCDGWDDFASAVISLLTSGEHRRDLEIKAREYASEAFNCEKIYAPLQELLQKQSIKREVVQE